MTPESLNSEVTTLKYFEIGVLKRSPPNFTDKKVSIQHEIFMVRELISSRDRTRTQHSTISLNLFLLYD